MPPKFRKSRKSPETTRTEARKAWKQFANNLGTSPETFRKKSGTSPDKIWKMYELGADGRKLLGEKAYRYATSEFSYQKTVDLWHDTMLRTLGNWKSKHDYYTIKEI